MSTSSSTAASQESLRHDDLSTNLPLKIRQSKGLLGLPEELLDQVVSQTDRTSQLSLCRTCKKLQRLANTHLYSRICIGQNFDLIRLGHFLLKSPERAALVRTIVVSPSWARIDSRVQEVLTAECGGIGLYAEETRSMFSRVKHNHSEDVMLALLLANLPSLQALDIDFGQTKHEEFHRVLAAFGDRVTSGRPVQMPWPNYRGPEYRGLALEHKFVMPLDVIISGVRRYEVSPYNEPNLSSHIPTFFHVPCLRSFYAWGLCDKSIRDVRSNGFELIRPNTCRVEHIELRMCKLSMENMQYLLAATIPGYLKTFMYHVGNTELHHLRSTNAICRVNNPSMMRSLAAHHTTLEYLSLNHSGQYPYSITGDDMDDRPKACSFVQFEALKGLKVAPAFLWGHDRLCGGVSSNRDLLWKALPRGLSELWMLNPDRQLEEDPYEPSFFLSNLLLPALDALIVQKPTMFVNLYRLHIEIYLDEWTHDLLNMLTPMCQRAVESGISEVVLLIWPGYLQHGEREDRGWGWDGNTRWEPREHDLQQCQVRIDCAEEKELARVLADMLSVAKPPHDSEAEQEAYEAGFMLSEDEYDPDEDGYYDHDGTETAPDTA